VEKHKLTLGIIGCGGFSKFAAYVFSKIPELVIGAVYDVWGRCCINIVNSLNLLHFQVCDEKRKLLNFMGFSGIMQQRRRTRPVIGFRNMRFCATKYSFRNNRS